MNELNYFSFITPQQLSSIVRIRSYETKLGEKVQTIVPQKTFAELEITLQNCTAKFVLIGIPEDIGVRANYGRSGAYSAWLPALDNLLNIQSNSFFAGDELLVLGNIIFDDLNEEAAKYNSKVEDDIFHLRQITAEVDMRVTQIINAIAKSGKTIIVVGGGHNNAYPIIKGFSSALNTTLNIVNIDPHSDFRPLEGRHSGNGFSYAHAEKLIKNYTVIGLHESYNSKKIIDDFNANSNLQYYTYEDLFLRETISIEQIIESCIMQNANSLNGLEIDLDAIQNIPSSAKTSSGFLPIDVRKFIYKYASKVQPKYLHIAEGAPVLSHIKTDNKTGKLIAYLIADFIKATH